MTLTKKLAVALHRRLWNWVANESERQKRIVSKSEYPLFKHLKTCNNCWCCEYARERAKIGLVAHTKYENKRIIRYNMHCQKCEYCPLKWKAENCISSQSEYGKWVSAETWQEAVYWARIIAQLPERYQEANNYEAD